MSVVHNTKKKTKVKKKFNFKMIKIILILGAFIYVSYTFVSQQFQINSLKKKSVSIDSQIKIEQKRNEQLKQKKSDINSPEYMEKIARNSLNLVAPDEIIFMEAPKNK